mmetsp:Transcript_15142/g.19163  ORF Transcript_15142/g.19163 Transcript_15142/m.19163 type:complete len:97 (+) Transcript_15142:1359-1649(+)
MYFSGKLSEEALNYEHEKATPLDTCLGTTLSMTLLNDPVVIPSKHVIDNVTNPYSIKFPSLAILVNRGLVDMESLSQKTQEKLQAFAPKQVKSARK